MRGDRRYVSDTSVFVTVPSGIGKDYAVILTILGYEQPVSNLFSYLVRMP